MLLLRYLLVAIVVGVYDARDWYGLFRLVAVRAASADAHHAFMLLPQERLDQLVHVQGLLLQEPRGKTWLCQCNLVLRRGELLAHPSR